MFVARLVSLFIACLSPLAGPASVAAAESAISPADGPIRILDGHRLAGCYTFLKDAKYEDPRGVFTVNDGVLRISGDGFGSVITQDAYRDYHAIVEYKWGERTWHDRADAARDSGLLIHSAGPDGGYGGMWMPSIEVQIIEGGVGDFILVTEEGANPPTPIALTCETARDRDGEVIWQAGGRRETFDLANRQRINWFGRDEDWKDVRGFRGRRDADSPHGQWTRLDVIAAGGRIEVFVNGVKVNEALDASPQAGKLQLQSELAELFVRRWELWPPGKAPPPAPAEQ
ncbi:MAG: DUF1080 domain-containing protein [Planctomycetota bacterium]|nr:MAG: DUF1080 domain-containing protein [Planctomycetota bacterium]